MTKEPVEEHELSFLFNVNETRALDASGYYAQKFHKVGVTLFASRNTQEAYDVNHDDLSDIPQYQRYSFNPRVIYYVNSSARISFGLNTNFENRIGGDMTVINERPDAIHTYFERNKTQRISSQLKAEKNIRQHKAFH